MQYLKIVVTVIIALEVIISSGCNTVNGTTDINISNGATNTVDTTSTNDVASTVDISINSISGRMSLSLGKLYLLSVYSASDNNYRGTIWVDGNKLIDGEITRICVDNGNVYFSDSNGVNRFNGETTLQVPGKNVYYAVMNEKIYYITNKDNKSYCYNVNDRTNTFITDEPMIFIVNSDYIVCHGPHDILIMDNKSYNIIKRLHYEKTIGGFSLDKDNLYFVQYTYSGDKNDRFELTKYSIKQDNQIVVFDSNELVGDVYAIDDKIVFLSAVGNQLGIGYIDMRNMENKYFTTDVNLSNMNDDIIDILFDGQRIIYERRDQTFYSINISTGETKKIELNS